MSDRAAMIERLLKDAFNPTELLVKDQSHLHVGHAGAKEGKGHFDVTLTTDKFTGLSRIIRHRMVYDALGSLMHTDVHALRINALSPQD
ncbi:MAG: BolA family transcriptional regulator [Gammaproteobacteria bacterium]|nr:BolA family transcriptional regulator [Gammaproteobacteria bacterium]MDH5322773.1 BolA family transcriptional regulator [Gammaproteobacteria bacterium]